MYKKEFKFYFLVAAVIMLSLAGCKKWLDTDAPLQVDQGDVYSTEQGFREVLNGVYLQMGSRSLYGRDLTFGLLSVLGRSYDTTITPAIGNLYYEGARYNFQDATGGSASAQRFTRSRLASSRSASARRSSPRKGAASR